MCTPNVHNYAKYGVVLYITSSKITEKLCHAICNAAYPTHKNSVPAKAGPVIPVLALPQCPNWLVLSVYLMDRVCSIPWVGAPVVDDFSE